MICTVNLAFQQPTCQSSLFDIGWTGGSYLAVDGSKNTRWFDGGCCAAMALNDSSPWWAVELGAPTYVYGVSFTNRGDCCGSYT